MNRKLLTEVCTAPVLTYRSLMSAVPIQSDVLTNATLESTSL